MFERSQSVGVNNENQCELYRRLSDRFEIVVKLIDHFDVQNDGESENQHEIQNEIEKPENSARQRVVESVVILRGAQLAYLFEVGNAVRVQLSYGFQDVAFNMISNS
jgi:GTP1/Obg family GTP-binding protein